VHTGNIWKATVSSTVCVLFICQYRFHKTVARTPNTGTFSATATGTSITSAAIGSSGLSTVGANLCLREHDWQLNRQVISTVEYLLAGILDSNNF
jgi:hypothetical protein